MLTIALRVGGDVKAKSFGGYTPLHIAAIANYHSIYQHLVGLGEIKGGGGGGGGGGSSSSSSSSSRSSSSSSSSGGGNLTHSPVRGELFGFHTISQLHCVDVELNLA